MNKPLICAIGASVGVVATGVLSADAACKIKDNYAIDKSEKPIAQLADICKSNWRTLLPPVLAGAGTIGAVFIGYGLGRKQLATAAASATAAGALLSKYRDEIRERLGDDGYSELVGKISEKSETREHVKSSGNDYPIQYGMFGTSVMEIPKDNDTMFYDEYSDIWFKSNLPAVLAAITHLNRNLNICGAATVKEFYELQDIDYEGVDGLGWDYYKQIQDTELGWVDISVIRKKDDDYYVITFDTMPYDLESVNED